MYPVPPPPFKASKRVAKIMYDLWYGRITVEQARRLGVEYGMAEGSFEDIIAQATEPPSYWSNVAGVSEADEGS